MARPKKRRLAVKDDDEESEESENEVEEAEEPDGGDEGAPETEQDMETETEYVDNEEEEDEMKIIGDYKHGSIARMKLHNFLTYADVEFCPGPRLNMVVGPNGTGKSTILCAMCLGLGGEPRLLGRASDIETFVMNGKTEAEIEIELSTTKETVYHRSNRGRGEIGNIIVKRVIRRKSDGNGSPTKQPKSSFYIMDEPISAKALRDMVLSDFSIAIDNLCTFLPQDRVGSFSGFDSKALLIETEKSISPELYDTHLKLIKTQEILSSGTDAVENLKEKLEHLQSDRQRLERERQRMEERELAERQVDLIGKKILWLKFDEARYHCLNEQEKRNKFKENFKAVEAEMAPLKHEHERAVDECRKADLTYNTLDKETQGHQNQIRKQKEKYEQHDDGIEVVIAELNSMDSKKAGLAVQVEAHRKRVDDIAASLEGSPDLELIEKEWQEVISAKEKNMPDYQAAKREVRHLTEEFRSQQDQCHRAKSRLDELNDEKGRQRQRVFSQQPNLKKICDWLDQNRNQFRRQIWGPIVLEMQTSTREAADCIEQHVPNSTLKSFIVQDKEDYNLLYEKVRVQMKLPINIIIVRNGEMRPISQRLYSDEKMAILKQNHGIAGYMDEQVSAHDAVLEALISQASIHKVLMGTRKTQDSLDNHGLLDFLSQPERGQTGLQSFALFSNDGSKSVRYAGTVSRYANTKVIRVEDTRSARWLAPGVDDDAKQRATAALENAKSVMADIQSRLEAAQQSHDGYREEAQQLAARATEIKETRSQIMKLQSKLSNAQRKLREAEETLAADDRVEKKKKVTVLQNRIVGSVQALESHSQSHGKMMETTFRCAGLRITKEKRTAYERQIRQLVDEKKVEFDEAKRDYEKAHAAFKKLRDSLRALKDGATAKAPLYDEHQNPLPLKIELENMPLETVVEAEAALEEAEVKVNSIDADPNVIRQYNSVLKQIEDLQADVDNRTSDRKTRELELRTLREPWENRLNTTVENVDRLFSVYMRELGCTGEIKMTKGTTEEEQEGRFQDYGIEIRVSFREGVKAQVLSARVQSGGERSVSTIMYLMALQEMMVSPFRCVDEINQGLDDRNERLVFKRIVENSTRPPGPRGPTDHCGQYFLITPKLLPNLYDMEVEAMTVLSIFNGSYNFRNPNDWDVSRINALRKAMGDVSEREDEEAEAEAEAEEPSRKRARA